MHPRSPSTQTAPAIILFLLLLYEPIPAFRIRSRSNLRGKRDHRTSAQAMLGVFHRPIAARADPAAGVMQEEKCDKVTGWLTDTALDQMTQIVEGHLRTLLEGGVVPLHHVDVMLVGPLAAATWRRPLFTYRHTDIYIHISYISYIYTHIHMYTHVHTPTYS